MTAFSFFTRPAYFCAHCGCATQQEIDIDDDPGVLRSIWCNNPHCDQSGHRVRVHDPVLTMVGDKSHMVFKDDDRTLPLQLPIGNPADEDDPNGRC
jgi:hypothetical protein